MVQGPIMVSMPAGFGNDSVSDIVAKKKVKPPGWSVVTSYHFLYRSGLNTLKKAPQIYAVWEVAVGKTIGV